MKSKDADTSSFESLLVDQKADLSFLMECFSDYGGFSKYNLTKKHPDILHTFYSIAAVGLNLEHTLRQSIDGSISFA